MDPDYIYLFFFVFATCGKLRKLKGSKFGCCTSEFADTLHAKTVLSGYILAWFSCTRS